ncbi:DUF4251 domain-containing protein [Mesonia sp. MT50]|uniref:DUF4251 domain-containing protein n=1 Tax=Mesonia profundi TaxID=3070998 RepID=A0ABU1A1Y0_9FLAO|nr:DUF4251 domain-containing protein [Mesonia profundi]MDQ7917639.1 DUF4251 domain-containing protein [Mesonia profundi]
MSLISIGLWSCSSLSSAQKESNAKEISRWLDHQEVHIDLNTAYPRSSSALQQLANNGLLAPGNTSNVINLSSSKSFIKIHQDSIQGYLPYYGTRQTAGRLGENGSINFHDLPKNYSEHLDPKTLIHHIAFEIPQKKSSEAFQIQIQIYPSKKAQVSVNSSQRDGISYQGKVQKLKE